MRTINAALQARLEKGTCSLSYGVKVVLVDTTVFSFSDSDREFIYDGVTYSPLESYTQTQVSDKVDMSVGSLEIEGAFTAVVLLSDMLKHKFDGAAITIYLFDSLRPDLGPIITVKEGWIGDIHIKDETFKAELRSIKQTLHQTIGRLYKVSCDAHFGDTRCGVDVTDFDFTGEVTGVTNNSTFSATVASTPAEDARFTFGTLTWSSGNNNGVTRQVRIQTYSAPTDSFVLLYSMEGIIQIGDTFVVIEGCDKSWTHCREFGVFKHRGFPYSPGQKILQNEVRVR